MDRMLVYSMDKADAARNADETHVPEDNVNHLPANPPGQHHCYEISGI